MPLTPAEKIAGRLFVQEEQAKLTQSLLDDPPDSKAPNFLSHWRHECKGVKGEVSTAIELKEVYIFSPAYGVEVDSKQCAQMTQEDADDAGLTFVPAGRLGFIYKQGVCKARLCQHTCRSPAGKVVDAYERPPLEGRVARSGRAAS